MKILNNKWRKHTSHIILVGLWALSREDGSRGCLGTSLTDTWKLIPTQGSGQTTEDVLCIPTSLMLTSYSSVGNDLQFSERNISGLLLRFWDTMFSLLWNEIIVSYLWKFRGNVGYLNRAPGWVPASMWPWALRNSSVSCKCLGFLQGFDTV